MVASSAALSGQYILHSQQTLVLILQFFLLFFALFVRNIPIEDTNYVNVLAENNTPSEDTTDSRDLSNRCKLDPSMLALPSI